MRRGYDASKAQRVGYGQVEPNHLSAQKTGQIYAQLPAIDKTKKPITQLENGQFLKYNLADGRACVDGDNDFLLVYNEEKVYETNKQNHKDFCLKVTDSADGLLYPRLFKVNVGDIFTTNMFGGASTGNEDTKTFPALAVADKVVVNENGFLEKAGAGPLTGMVFQVVKVYTMPDGQMGIKVQRVK